MVKTWNMSWNLMGFMIERNHIFGRRKNNIWTQIPTEHLRLFLLCTTFPVVYVHMLEVEPKSRNKFWTNCSEFGLNHQLKFVSAANQLCVSVCASNSRKFRKSKVSETSGINQILLISKESLKSSYPKKFVFVSCETQSTDTASSQNCGWDRLYPVIE